jgi:hypothetical protein
LLPFGWLEKLIYRWQLTKNVITSLQILNRCRNLVLEELEVAGVWEFGSSNPFGRKQIRECFGVRLCERPIAQRLLGSQVSLTFGFFGCL